MRKSITILKGTFNMLNTIVALVELYDFGTQMYRKHVLKPKTVTGFTIEPSSTTEEPINVEKE